MRGSRSVAGFLGVHCDRSLENDGTFISMHGIKEEELAGDLEGGTAKSLALDMSNGGFCG